MEKEKKVKVNLQLLETTNSAGRAKAAKEDRTFSVYVDRLIREDVGHVVQ
jgi:hypothetical protein